jgi:membrane-bound serine protease (ClpP class)
MCRIILSFLLLFNVVLGYADDQLVNPTALERLKEHIHYSDSQPNTVGHILIGGHDTQINQATFLYVKAALDHYKQTKPIFIILELDTPGGEVFAAQRISDALKEMDIQYEIPIVAYINNWAISAGAMLAYSCRFITVVKDGSMGAAEPITISGDKMETASEKINSALRADFANRAQFFDRNPAIAEAMVDKDIILVKRQGKIIEVDSEKDIITESPRDILIKAKGKLLTLTAQEMINEQVADLLLLPQKLEPITAQEQETGHVPASKTLLFQQPFFKEIPNATIDAFQMDWKTKFFAFLANPIVSSLLFMGLMLGVYMELNGSGFGLAGTLAVTCLFLIGLSSFALEAINWLEVIFLVTGLAIILVELFVLPTFGLLGFIGILLFLAGLFGMMIPGLGSVSFDYSTSSWNGAGEYVLSRLAWLSGAFLLSLLLMFLFGRYLLPRFRLFSHFVLEGQEQNASEGYTAGGDPSLMPKAGSKGIVAATLRPAGKVTIDDQLYDAVSEGGFIEKGTPIVVQRVEGSRIIVNLEPKELEEFR